MAQCRNYWHWVNHAAVVLATPILLWWAYEGYKSLIADTRPPVTVYNAYIANSPVQRGGKLSLVIERIKTRQCPSKWNRWIIADDGVQHELGVIAGSGPEDTSDTLEINRAIPFDIPPGKYLYRAWGEYYCPDRRHIVTQPDAPFEIVK